MDRGIPLPPSSKRLLDGYRVTPLNQLSSLPALPRPQCRLPVQPGQLVRRACSEALPRRLARLPIQSCRLTVVEPCRNTLGGFSASPVFATL